MTDPGRELLIDRAFDLADAYALETIEDFCIPLDPVGRLYAITGPGGEHEVRTLAAASEAVVRGAYDWLARRGCADLICEDDGTELILLEARGEK